MADILFDLESKIREWFLGLQELGIKETTVTQEEPKAPEPEKIEPPKEPTPTPQPSQKTYPTRTPLDRTVGRPKLGAEPV